MKLQLESSTFAVQAGNAGSGAVVQPQYQYQCSHGHDLEARAPLTRCPAYRFGKPCDGTLKPVGRGSRSTSGDRRPAANRSAVA